MPAAESDVANLSHTDLTRAELTHTDLTQANLADYLRDIQLPEPVTWWPVAPGWWLIALLLLLSLFCFAFNRRRKNSSNLDHQLKQVYTDFQHNGDTQQYYSRMTRLLREAALDNTNQVSSGSHPAVALHGAHWVDWLEHTTGVHLSPSVSTLLSDSCYQKFPQPPNHLLHHEITRCIAGLSKPDKKSSDKQLAHAINTKADAGA